MSRDSTIDCIACILFRVCGPLIRILPLSFSFFLGRRLGDAFYYFDLRHKTLAYSNIKTALGDKLSPSELSHLTRRFYQAFGQNLIEIFLIPAMDKNYMDKYILAEGYSHVGEAFKRGRGVILLSMHAGCWELSNIICAYFGFPFVLFVREQRFPRLNRLLNAYRSQKSYKIIEKESGVRELLKALRHNEAIGMMADQGGRSGTIIRFFDREASMPSGAIKFALKYDAAIVPVYYTRLKDARIKVIFAPILQIKKTGDIEKDTRDNLQELMPVYEKNIRKYPHEYLWTYKIWKYGQDRKILILNDGKAGHLRQAQAVAKIASACLQDRGLNPKIDTIEIKFKNNFSRLALTLSSCLAGKYHCQGCLWCLKTFLEENTYHRLGSIKPDVVISCGSSLPAINYALTRENLSKSIVIMRPSLFSTRRFDLVIMPRHDHPPLRKNVVVTDGALNLIDEQYLREQSDKLLQRAACSVERAEFYIGLLIGGESRNFHLPGEIILEVIKQIKSVAEKYNGGILLTTSRRTSGKIEDLLKQEFQDYPLCKLLIIANEKNIPEAVGGILGLSRVVIVSPESISMISEAATSGRYVFAFQVAGLDAKHEEFLAYFARNKYISLTGAVDLSADIAGILESKPQVNTLRDNLRVKEAVGKIL